MQEVKNLLESNLNIDFLGATLSNPKDKNSITKVKVRPVLQHGMLYFQCESHKNNQVFHENWEVSEAVNILGEYFVYVRPAFYKGICLTVIIELLRQSVYCTYDTLLIKQHIH